VCLHLACRLFGESFDKTLAARVCGIDPKSYIQMYTSISNILDVKNCGPSLKELGIKFGCPDAASLAERALAMYYKTKSITKKDSFKDYLRTENLILTLQNPSSPLWLFFYRQNIKR
jgi:hypothetical protein